MPVPALVRSKPPLRTPDSVVAPVLWMAALPLRVIALSMVEEPVTARVVPPLKVTPPAPRLPSLPIDKVPALTLVPPL
ncbi:hypothetical protein D9M70_550100 [compost metagenome]